MRFLSRSQYQVCRNLVQHQVIRWLFRSIVFEYSELECWTSTWRLLSYCSRVRGEVDFRVCSCYNYPNEFFQVHQAFLTHQCHRRQEQQIKNIEVEVDSQT